jgi:hypothetical protein
MGQVLQMNDVRPDIKDALAIIATHTQESNTHDMLALINVIRYLWCTRTMGVILRPGNHGLSPRQFLYLRAYADASYGCMANGKSKFNTCYDLVEKGIGESVQLPQPLEENTGMFFSYGKVGETTALSSSDSEHTAVVEATKTVIFVRGVLAEMHQPQLDPTPIFNDNKSTISLGMDYSGHYKRVRYMIPQINWLKDKTDTKIVSIHWLHTDLLPPDMNTKVITGLHFKYKRAATMGHNLKGLAPKKGQ